jgi:hypothetical protein
MKSPMKSMVTIVPHPRTVFSLALALVFACGGGELARPRPVTSKLDEMYIARVPPDQRPEVSASQNEFQLARSNKMTAEDDFKKANTDVQLAQGEVEKATIEERSAGLKKKDADSSHDMTLANAAAAEVRAAQLARRAADAHVTYTKARRDYLKMVLRFHEFEVINKEARFELEKAKVAKSNNIRPDTGFDYGQFEAQQKDRSESAQRAKNDAEKLRSKMVDKEKAWKDAQKDADAAHGVTAPPPPSGELKGVDAEKPVDPNAPKTTP